MPERIPMPMKLKLAPVENEGATANAVADDDDDDDEEEEDNDVDDVEVAAAAAAAAAASCGVSGMTSTFTLNPPVDVAPKRNLDIFSSSIPSISSGDGSSPRPQLFQPSSGGRVGSLAASPWMEKEIDI